MTTWKAVERSLATLLGGRRVPVTGRQRGDAPDIQHDIFSVEVKHRQKIPSWILEAMEQAIASNTSGKLYPLVLLHQKNMPFLQTLAVLSMKDLLEMSAKAKAHDEYIKRLEDTHGKNS